jgi:hypothetical protein
MQALGSLCSRADVPCRTKKGNIGDTLNKPARFEGKDGGGPELLASTGCAMWDELAERAGKSDVVKRWDHRLNMPTDRIRQTTSSLRFVAR